MQKENGDQNDFDPAEMTAKIKGTIDYLSRNKVVKYVGYGVGLIALLYASSYLMDAAAKAVASWKNLDNAIKS